MVEKTGADTSVSEVRMPSERALGLFKISSPWLRNRVKEGGDCQCKNCLYCAWLTLVEALGLEDLLRRPRRPRKRR
jgi:hypothetical protein